MLPKPDIDTFRTEGESTSAGPQDLRRFDRELIEAIGNPVYLKDREGKFICVNRAWEQFYGFKREVVIGKVLHDIFPPTTADAHAIHDAAFFNGPGPRVYEITVRGGEGEMHDTVHYKSVFSRADGTPAGIIGNLTDITSVKRTENALRLSELQMRLISDNVPALIAYFDIGLCCAFCNKAYAEWFGGTTSNFQGRHLQDIIGPEAFAQSVPQFAAAFAGDSISYERYGTGVPMRMAAHVPAALRR